MASIGHETIGIGSLKRKLQGLKGAAAGDLLISALTAGALPIQAEAKQLAPKLTTTLSRAITIRPLDSSGTRATVAVAVDNVPYARIQEFGGVIKPKSGQFLVFDGKDGKKVFVRQVTIRAQPYLRPAFDSRKAEAVREVARALRILIKKAVT